MQKNRQKCIQKNAERLIDRWVDRWSNRQVSEQMVKNADRQSIKHKFYEELTNKNRWRGGKWTD